MKTTINQAQLDKFMAVYEPALAEAIANYPKEYMPGLEASVVAAKMRVAIEAGTFNHDGRAFKATCKTLSIKHTRKAIYAFLAE